MGARWSDLVAQGEAELMEKRWTPSPETLQHDQRGSLFVAMKSVGDESAIETPLVEEQLQTRCESDRHSIRS